MKISESLIDRTTVFVTTMPDGERAITDRYVLWRFPDAPEKLRRAVAALPDGVWSLSATGQAKQSPPFKNEDFTMLGRSIARILAGVTYDARDEALRSTAIVTDEGTPRRFWANDESTYLFDDRLRFNGRYRLFPHNARKAAIVMPDGSIAGAVMTVRPGDSVLDDLRLLAERFPHA